MPIVGQHADDKLALLEIIVSFNLLWILGAPAEGGCLVQ